MELGLEYYLYMQQKSYSTNRSTYSNSSLKTMFEIVAFLKSIQLLRYTRLRFPGPPSFNSTQLVLCAGRICKFAENWLYLGPLLQKIEQILRRVCCGKLIILS
jgi:hypothetical protein